MARYRLYIGVLACLAAFAVYIALVQLGGSARPADSGPAEVKIAAPDIAIRAESRTVRLSDLKGKVVLLDFWATWCGPCRLSIPTIQALYQKYHSRGFEVMGVAVNDSGDRVTAFKKDMGMTYPAGLPAKMESVLAYPTSSIPFMALIDKQGNIRWKMSGYAKSIDTELYQQIERLLRE